MRTTKVLYVLGAGFSAPLGLPLIRNFFEMSHVMHDQDPERYADFERVYELVRDLARAKNYYRTNLFNIEEILSLVELRARLVGDDQTKLVEDYIRAPIE